MLNALVLAVAATVSINEKTGGFSAFGHSFENRYLLMEKGKPDVTALEREDVVEKRTKEDGLTVFVCSNPKMPGVKVSKRYIVDNSRKSVRRTLEFSNSSEKSKYVTPYVDCTFPEGFKRNLWHFGAGYIGPYKPFPDVKSERVVNDYKQSSKGLVLIHPENGLENSGIDNLSHYRVKINDQVVWPWWNSSIGRYREYHDRLSYLPNGYRMGLGTFGLYKGKPISVTDQFNAFDGNAFTFFDGIFAADEEIAAEIKSIPAAPKWFDDVFNCGAGSNHEYEIDWYAKMIDEGHFIPRHWGTFSWAEYVPELGLRGTQGGFVTTDEFAAFMDRIRARDPKRIHPSHYSIVISASWFTRVLKDHPEWFRVHDRNGAVDSLFPGVSDNFQTMFNNPDCREWMVEMLVRFCKRLGNDVVYIDETQQTNTIDWDRDQVTLDSDSVKFWKLLRKRFSEEGILFWANGSGNPYADLNYMESPCELEPSRWRDWAGVGFGISMINRMKKGNRTSLLTWMKPNDYANRIAALGWIPHPYPNNDVGLPVMRAVYQEGNLFPADVRYAPDWRKDAAVKVESHAMKRADAPDVVLSFINRAGKCNIPVTIDLTTLGFKADERIAVWKLHYDEFRNTENYRHVLSDREIKSNWRERGIVAGARVTDPELLYSGLAKGVLKDTIVELGKDKMEQYVVTAAGPAFFAVDGQPIHAFFTAQRHGNANGKTVSLERDADILLVDREFAFADVTANGNSVRTRSILLSGGCVGALIRLEKGKWKLGWKVKAKGEERKCVKPELPIAPEKRPETSVPKMKVYQASGNYEVKDVVRDLGSGVSLLKKGVSQTPIRLFCQLQENVPLVCTEANEERLMLKAGPSRRQFHVFSLETYAGFELKGARQARLRLSHNFNDGTLGVSRNRFKTGDNAGNPTEYFGGILVDYSVGGRYSKRVSMASAFYNPKCTLKGAKWGKHGIADERLDFGAWIEQPSPKEFSLDIAKFAPKGWDGKIWLSLGTCRFLAGHHLELEILSFNDASAKDFIVPGITKNARVAPPPLKSMPLKSRPKSLVSIDPEEWKGWAKTDPFWLRASGRPQAQTRAYIAHDYEYFYMGIEADEPNTPQLSGQEAWSNDHIEFLVDRSDGHVYQVIASPKSETVLLLDRRRNETKGIVVRDSVETGKGWKLFMAVPLDDLKPNMQLTPVTLKMEIARVRKANSEYSTWAPIDTGFFELGSYGTVILDFSWTK